MKKCRYIKCSKYNTRNMRCNTQHAGYKRLLLVLWIYMDSLKLRTR